MSAWLLAAMLAAPGARAAAPGVAVCKVGLFVLGLSQIHVAERTADADLYLWSKCPKKLAPEDAALTFVTASEESRSETYEARFDGGIRYRFERVRAKIRVPVSLRRYPFDEQKVTIDIEPTSGIQSLRLVLDDDPAHARKPRCCIDGQVQLPDWEILESKAEILPHAYDTQFGYSSPDPKPSLYDRLTFTVRLKRLIAPYVLKVLLPLLIVLAVAYARCFWRVEEVEASVTVIVTALLSVVALHLSHATGLADVGYLVAGDLFFLHSYVMLLALLGGFLVENRWVRAARRPAAARLLRWEKLLYWPLVLAGWACVGYYG